MSFITDMQLQETLANVLKRNPSDVFSNWTQLLEDANAAAYADILSTLIARGYRKTDIDAWPQGAAYQKLQGTFWVLALGGGLHGFDGPAIDRLDQREKLLTIMLTDADGNLIGTDSVGFGDFVRDNSEFLDASTGDFKPW